MDAKLSYYDWFRQYYSETRVDLARDYILVSAEDERPVSATEFKEHNKLDGDHSESDTYINLLIDVATMAAESFMRRDIVDKTYKVFFPVLRDGLELRKYPVTGITSVEYIDTAGSWQTVSDSDYYLSEDIYPKIYAVPNAVWPSYCADYRNPVRITFTAGMSNAYPNDIKLAILHHVSVMYEQRGDWGSADFGAAAAIGSIPSVSRMVYGKLRISNR